MDGTATINAKVDSLRLCGFVQNLACAKPRRCEYAAAVLVALRTQVREPAPHPFVSLSPVPTLPSTTLLPRPAQRVEHLTESHTEPRPHRHVPTVPDHADPFTILVIRRPRSA